MLVLKQSIPVENAMDVCILEKSNTGDKELSFTITVKDPAYQDIDEEVSIELQEDEYYVVKSIEQVGETATVTCRLDLDAFKVAGVLNYSETEDLSSLLAFCMTGTGWTVEGADEISGEVLNELEAGCVLDLMNVAEKNYNVIFKYNTRKKIIKVIRSGSGENKGAFLTEELNLKKFSRRRDSYDICTRLIPIGEDGLTIESVNDGLKYVDNFSYTNKIITKVLRMDGYTDPQAMKDATIEYLKRNSIPSRVYDGETINLAEIDEKYRNLRFSVGDLVTLVDTDMGSRTVHEIVVHRRYPYEPERDSVEINKAAESFEQIVTGLADRTQEMFVSNRKKISEVKQTVEGLYVRVNDTYTRGETDSVIESKIQVESNKINATVANQSTIIEGHARRITAAEAQLLLQADEILMRVKKDGVISAINLSPETVKIAAKFLELSGHVTISDLEEGTTTVDGGCITTGVLKSNDGKTFYLDLDNGTFTMQGSGRFENEDGTTYITVDGDEIIMFSDSGDGFLEKLRIGFTYGPNPYGTGNVEYPHILFGNANGGQVGLIKKFWNGLWMGNSAPLDEYGIFEGCAEAVGIFVDTTDGKTYVVNGLNMQSIYTGEAIAKFA